MSTPAGRFPRIGRRGVPGGTLDPIALTLATPRITLTLAPASAVLPNGGAVGVSVSVARRNTNSAVVVSVAGATGVTASALTIPSGQTSGVLTLTDAGASVGPQSLTITGTAGAVIGETPLALTVQAPVVASTLTLGLTGGALTLQRSETVNVNGTRTITIAQTGVAEPVTITVGLADGTPLPTGVLVGTSPANPIAAGVSPATTTVTVQPAATDGARTIRFTGTTPDGRAHTVDLPLTITAPAPPPAAGEPFAPSGRFVSHNGRDRYPFELVTNAPFTLPDYVLDTTEERLTAAEQTVYTVTSTDMGNYGTAPVGSFRWCLAQADAAGGGIIEIPVALGPLVSGSGNGSGAFPGHGWNDGFRIERASAKLSGGWITIRTQAHAGLQLPPAGTRVTPEQGATFARFRSPTGSNEAVFTITGSAYKLRFIGVTIEPNPAQGTTSGVMQAQLGAEQIIFDRVYGPAYADEYKRCSRWLNSQADSFAVLDSYIGDYSDRISDSQAIAVTACRLGQKVVNNYLSATGEPYMAGGDAVPGQSAARLNDPRNLEFRRNHTRIPRRFDRRSPRWRDHPQAVVVRGGSSGQGGTLTVGAATEVSWYTNPLQPNANEGEFHLTLSSGTVDASQIGFNQANGTHYVVITSGPGAGGWGRLLSYDTSGAQPVLRVDTSGITGLWIGGKPGVGSVLEIRRAPGTLCKNAFELKNTERAFIHECVIEGGSIGDVGQNITLVIKVASNGATHPLTRDVHVWDCALVGTRGGFNTNIDGDPQTLATLNNGITTCDRIDFCNLLVLNTQQLGAAQGNSQGATICALTTAQTQARRISALNRAHWVCVFDDNVARASVVIDRCLIPMSTNGMIRSGAGSNPRSVWLAATTSGTRRFVVALPQASGSLLTASNWPQPSNMAGEEAQHLTHTSNASDLYVAPVTSGDWQAADWTPVPAWRGLALPPGDPSGQTTAAFGCDWSTSGTGLRDRLAGVRSNTPHEWEAA